ncbi:ATP-binding protein [Actinoplanes sp. NPDC026619]|uniref:ATP-binding protein n=1 Tax=Actinoplanes sp. NPDC026619 TaxID=3155798 RepID=UPI0033C63525
MAVQPPYLLTAVIGRPGVGVAVVGDAGMAVVEVAPHGQWSAQLGEEVSAALSMCLAGPSASIIIDLHELVDPHGFSLSFWLALWRQARLDNPPAHLMFCLPPTSALSQRLRHRQGPQPRVFATLPEARTAIADRMSRADRLQAQLAPQAASVRAARALVTQACEAWQRPELLDNTWLVVSELATNAVEHARTDLIVTVSHSGNRLHVAVHDCVRKFPQELSSAPAALPERGRGLRLVHTVAAAWGAMPTPDGKVVWATVR